MPRTTPVSKMNKAQLEALVREQQAVLEVAQQHTTAEAQAVADSGPAAPRSRKAELANIIGNVDAVLVRAPSIGKEKVFAVAADPAYNRYVAVSDTANGRTKRIPTDVLKDVIEHPERYAEIVAVSEGRQAEFLAEQAEAQRLAAEKLAQQDAAVTVDQ